MQNKQVQLISDPTRQGVVISGPWFVQGENWWNVLIDGLYGRHPQSDLKEKEGQS